MFWTRNWHRFHSDRKNIEGKCKLLVQFVCSLFLFDPSVTKKLNTPRINLRGNWLIFLITHTHKWTLSLIYNQLSKTAYTHTMICLEIWIKTKIIKSYEIYLHVYFIWVAITRGSYLLAKWKGRAWSGWVKLSFSNNFSMLSPSQHPHRPKKQKIGGG